MRRSESLSLSDVLKQLVSERHWDKKMNEVRLLNAVEEVLGPSISAYISGKRLYGKTLYLNVTSSIVRSELMMSRGKLAEQLNQKVGAQIISEIVIK